MPQGLREDSPEHLSESSGRSGESHYTARRKKRRGQSELNLLPQKMQPRKRWKTEQPLLRHLLGLWIERCLGRSSLLSMRGLGPSFPERSSLLWMCSLTRSDRKLGNMRSTWHMASISRDLTQGQLQAFAMAHCLVETNLKIFKVRWP